MTKGVEPLRAARSRVAVIGLGSMGLGMASSLVRSGFDVAGCDVSPEAVARAVEAGVRGAATPAETHRWSRSSSLTP